MGNKLICRNCFEVFDEDNLAEKYKNKKWNTMLICPKTSCNTIAVIGPIDDMITPTVLELNKKGYLTDFCCSGHYNDYDLYIKFEFNIIIPKNIPKGFVLEEDNIIRYNPDNVNILEDTLIIEWEELLEANKCLYLWALSLPKY